MGKTFRYVGGTINHSDDCFGFSSQTSRRGLNGEAKRRRNKMPRFTCRIDASMDSNDALNLLAILMPQ
ncbi:hypothetical protein P8452_47215 [Trifolium repens]|nr:hypothetical protein P8452_47215 [Trifolium repens]